MHHLAGVDLFSSAANIFASEADRASFHPDTVPVFEHPDYLIGQSRSDYWRLVNYYSPQSTSSACSVAATAMAINALRSGAGAAEEGIAITEDALLAAVGDAWRARAAEGGPGVTFGELREYLSRSLAWIELPEARVEAVAFDRPDETSLTALRAALDANEAAPESLMLAYYNQSVLTGDDGGLHVSPIGAYDRERDRVLIMDVDRELHLPYWTSTEALLDAFATPASAEGGALAGETGGYIRIAMR
jgi:hypothetical protein